MNHEEADRMVFLYIKDAINYLSSLTYQSLYIDSKRNPEQEFYDEISQDVFNYIDTTNLTIDDKYAIKKWYRKVIRVRSFIWYPEKIRPLLDDKAIKNIEKKLNGKQA